MSTTEDVERLDFMPYSDLGDDDLRAAWLLEAGHVAAWRAKIREVWATKDATSQWKRQREAFLLGCIDGSLAIMVDYEDALNRRRLPKPTDIPRQGAVIL